MSLNQSFMSDFSEYYRWSQRTKIKYKLHYGWCTGRRFTAATQTVYYCFVSTRPLPDCKLLVCYKQAHYQTVYHCSATNMPITSLYTTGMLPTCPSLYCILLFCYQQAHYLTVYDCFSTNRPIIRRILLFCYQHAHYQTVYYWSATNGPLQCKEKERQADRRRDGTITSRNGREWGLEFPWRQRKTGKDGKVFLQRYLWCHDDLKGYQTVNYCSVTHMPITRLYTTVLLPTGPLLDCILLSCNQQAHYQTVYYLSATSRHPHAH